jgi:hypothetical protein
MKSTRVQSFRILPEALVVMLVLAPAMAVAQTVPAPKPFVIEEVRNPFVVAPDYKVTNLDDEFGQLAGFYAGKSIEDRLFIGGAGYWLVNGSGGDGLWYAGALTGWSMPAGSRIRFGARGLVGFGSAKLGSDIDIVRGFDDRNLIGRGFDGLGGDLRGATRFGIDGRGGTQVSTVRVQARDDFFVFEPQAEVLTRLTDHIGLNWAAGYRLTGLTDALDDRLNGATGNIGLQLQW